MASRLLKIAICYDFDGTLAPGNMQEHDFIPELELTSRDFWKDVKEKSEEHKADQILTYMYRMLEKARSSGKVRVTKDAFVEYGKTVKLFKGVNTWFNRINQYGKDTHRVTIEHYIISSGLREFIEGTEIAKHFKSVFASSFMYDQHGVAVWPALAVNYTTKTQYLFRINKGLLDLSDDTRINTYIDPRDRPMPFSHIIYIGDGSTDVPCMKLVKTHGGHSIAVYQPHSSKRRQEAIKLLREDRVNLVASANYMDGKPLDKQVKAIIAKIASGHQVEKMEKDCRRFNESTGNNQGRRSRANLLS